MPQLTPDAQRRITDLAARYQVNPDAVLTLLQALQEGGGRQAQFRHPDLGGMGQWSHGGMIMIGDMFNSELKARISGLCTELADWLKEAQGHSAAQSASQYQSQQDPGAGHFAMGERPTWWPADLGTPNSAGSQNDVRYATFSAIRRLAINDKGKVSIYDTVDHRISGVSQQQGLDQSVIFTSQHGPVRLTDLPLLATHSEERHLEPASPEPIRTTPEAAPTSVEANPLPNRQGDAPKPEDDIFAKIERLAELHRKHILTDEEFTAKKTELLSQL